MRVISAHRYSTLQVFCLGVGLVGSCNDVVTVEAAPVCLLDAVNGFLVTERLRLRAEREESVAAVAAEELHEAQSLSETSDVARATGCATTGSRVGGRWPHTC